MTKLTYILANGIKHTEKDNYENGCLPETAQIVFLEQLSFKGNSIQSVFEQLSEFFDIKIADITANSCEEIGRFDFQILEDIDGNKASDSLIALWKKEKAILYLADYSFWLYVQKTVELTKNQIKELKFQIN